MYICKLAQDLGVQDTIVDAIRALNNDRAKETAVDFLNHYTVVKITRSYTKSGFFNYNKRCIGLHAELFVEGRREDLISTFLHEVAHIIQIACLITTRNSAYEKAHGRGWKYIMRLLGQKPEVTSSYPYLQEMARVARFNRATRYEYACKDCGHVFRHNRRLKHEGARYHAQCRHAPNQGKLVLTVIFTSTLQS